MMVMLSATPTRFQPIHFANGRPTARSGLSISFPDGRFLTLGPRPGPTAKRGPPRPLAELTRRRRGPRRTAPCAQPTREAAGEILAYGWLSSAPEPRVGTRVPPKTSVSDPAGLLADRIEPRLLHVRQRSIEVLQRRTQHACSIEHRAEPLLHGGEPFGQASRRICAARAAAVLSSSSAPRWAAVGRTTFSSRSTVCTERPPG